MPRMDPMSTRPGLCMHVFFRSAPLCADYCCTVCLITSRLYIDSSANNSDYKNRHLTELYIAVYYPGNTIRLFVIRGV